MEKRSQFSSKLGFVLAAASSAIGLGNIWRFPYLAAKFGGGVFLIFYIFFVLTFGFSIMVSEIAIGRKTGKSPIGALRDLNKKYRFIGVIASIIAFLILPYYSVIGGWVIKYLFGYLYGEHSQMALEADGYSYFSEFTGKTWEPIILQAVFVLAIMVVILLGVKNGIEKASKLLMPILVFLSVAVAIYAVTLPGALEGVKYFIIPNFKNLTWSMAFQGMVAALGQMFYSMSLAMGIMITYGSYLSKKEDISKSVSQIEIFDTLIAFLAGLMIIPSVFVFANGDMSKLNQGPGLMFVTLPKVFESTGMSTLIGIVFFLLVLFAALTSGISLMEAVVSTICDEFKLNRKTATIFVTILSILIGMPSSLGFGAWSHIMPFGMDILTFFDFLTNTLLMPICAILTCIFVGHIMKIDVLCDEVKLSSAFKREKIFRLVIRYFAPIGVFLVLLLNILGLGG